MTSLLFTRAVVVDPATSALRQYRISIPVTNTSMNPARSTGPALLVGGWALAQLWLFWVAPLIGAAMAGSPIVS